MNKGLIKNSWAHPARVWDASPTVPPTVQDGGSETPDQPPRPQGHIGWLERQTAKVLLMRTE